MKRALFVLLLSTGVAVPTAAHGGGMPGGGGQGGMGGAGMLTVADDGSLLVTEMSVMAGVPGGPGGGMSGDRALLNITADGAQRWRAEFDEGWPMMPVTEGDLVVLALRADWWSGWSGGGDGGWTHGGGHGGGGGGGGGGGQGPHADTVTLVGLDLANGAERWRTVVDGDIASAPRFSPDGSRFYLTVRDLVDGPGGGIGNGPLHQGDAPRGHQLMSTTVVAIGRDGTVLWSLDLADGARYAGGGS
ncbi:MAG: hypothetical protein MUC56_01975 [Thermoanaerobaculales bacterium]|jgi:hypothetical protein|nr:hypothetical protein [Thermoanaerobaculales bacterium]